MDENSKHNTRDKSELLDTCFNPLLSVALGQPHPSTIVSYWSVLLYNDVHWVKCSPHWKVIFFEQQAMVKFPKEKPSLYQYSFETISGIVVNWR